MARGGDKCGLDLGRRCAQTGMADGCNPDLIMRLPIRNKFDRPLRIFMEPTCDEYEIPVGGEAIVRIEDGLLDSIDVEDGWVTIYDDSCCATVEVVSTDDQLFDYALRLTHTWLQRFGARDEAELIYGTVADLEPVVGYFTARKQVFTAFHDGLADEEQGSADTAPQDERLAACYRIGVQAARLNQTARETHAFPELDGPAPLDTDVVRSAFALALNKGG